MKAVGVIALLLFASFSLYGQSECADGPTPKDRRLKIIEKPKATYPKGENIEVRGTVTLRVEFLSNSTIGKISVIKGLPHGLTEQAIAAARKMKFEPAVKDCDLITVFMPVSYSFTLY